MAVSLSQGSGSHTRRDSVLSIWDGGQLNKAAFMQPSVREPLERVQRHFQQQQGNMNRPYVFRLLARCWLTGSVSPSLLRVTRESPGPREGCSSRDLSTWPWAAAPARSCFGGLMRSLPDSLPRVVALYRPAP